MPTRQHSVRRYEPSFLPDACGLRAISRKEIRMQPRGTDAIPLPPRANLEQYHNRAKGLLKACKADDGAAVRAWARQWLESLAALTGSRKADTPPHNPAPTRR